MYKMKSILALLPSLLAGTVLLAQVKPRNTNTKDTSNTAWVKAIPADDLIKWRRHIHENAEVSFKEENTSKYVEGILKGLGNIEIIKPAKTSIIGILKGSKPGKTVAFRADMDGLPIQEETGLAYASKNAGVSHACGHDAHTAMLLATATTLSEMQNQIKGTVYFIFQHAEEQAPGGAIDIVKSGVLKDVEAFLGCTFYLIFLWVMWAFYQMAPLLPLPMNLLCPSLVKARMVLCHTWALTPL